MEYQILECVGTADLEEVVNIAIRKGWKPQGGVWGWRDEQDIFFAQAMVRGNYEKEMQTLMEDVVTTGCRECGEIGCSASQHVDLSG